jgi:hypothetical protein
LFCIRLFAGDVFAIDRSRQRVTPFRHNDYIRSC